jgi:hypothetical protein
MADIPSLGTSKINRKEPLTMEQLNIIVTKLSNTLQLHNVCMYSLAFVGLLRFEDLASIKRSDLLSNPEYLTILIPKSKNDQLRKVGRMPCRHIVYFHFTCLGTEIFLCLLPHLIMLNPNPKSSRSSCLQFFWENHLYFHSFEVFSKHTRHLETCQLLNIIAQKFDLLPSTSGFYDRLSF